MRQIVFWQNFPNHLQSSLIRALADDPGIQVTLVCQEELPEWRCAIGWSPPDFGRAKVIIAPTDEKLRILVGQADSQTVHIFSGISGYPLVWQALRRIIATEARVGIYSEAVNWNGLKGLLRLLRGRWEQFQFGKHIDFILAIGHLSVRWFQICGYNKNLIYPFGYFVERALPVNDLSRPDSLTDPFRIIFIGQLVRRKGVDLLIQALHDIPLTNWRLDIVGEGKDRQQFENLVNQFGHSHQICFRGALSNDKAMQLLFQSDLLVLPSRWDGWGAVINEALLRGVPVVCSTNCGAADLLKDEVRGKVFLSGSVSSLRKNLYEQLEFGKLPHLRRTKIKTWAEAKVTGDTAAGHLLEILRYVQRPVEPRPIAAWLQVNK